MVDEPKTLDSAGDIPKPDKAGDTSIPQTQDPKAPEGEHPIQIKNDAGEVVKEYKNVEALTKAYTELQGVATQATQDSAALRKEKEDAIQAPTPTEEQNEEEKERLRTMQYDDPQRWAREVAEQATQRARQEIFQTQKVALRSACGQKHKDFGKYASVIDNMVNTGIAHSIMSYSSGYGAMENPYEVAYQFSKTPDSVKQAQDKALKDAQEKNSFTPPSSIAGTQLDAEGEVVLTSEEKEVAHGMFPKLSRIEAEKKFAGGKKL